MRLDDKVLRTKPLALLFADDAKHQYSEAMLYFASKGNGESERVRVRES